MTGTEIVQIDALPASAIAELDRKVEDFGVRQSLLPLRPFIIRGEITFLDWETYQGQAPKGAPPESEGLKMVIRVLEAEEPAFKSGKTGDYVAPVLKSGDEWPNIYFAKNPKLVFALPDHAKFRARLFEAIAPGQKPAAVLAKVRKQTLRIPVEMTRAYLRTTKNGADLFEDTFKLVK